MRLSLRPLRAVPTFALRDPEPVPINDSRGVENALRGALRANLDRPMELGLR